MDGTLLIFLIAIIIVAIALFSVIALTNKHGSNVLNKEKYRAKWLDIEKRSKDTDSQMRQIALLNADKLLDQALRERDMSGATMGERLKAADVLFKNSDHVWFAHKLRNRIAHESDVKISGRDYSRAINAFKQALKDVGAV